MKLKDEKLSVSTEDEKMSEKLETALPKKRVYCFFKRMFDLVLSILGLIILLVTHELIRQFAEPKIVGKSIGVHPVISLILLYVGYYALGFVGILFVPLLAVALNIFFDKKEEKSEKNHTA